MPLPGTIGTVTEDQCLPSVLSDCSAGLATMASEASGELRQRWTLSRDSALI